MQGTLFDSPKYKKFINDRDKVLEQIHLNTQTDISRLLFDLLDQVEKIVAQLLMTRYSSLPIALSQLLDFETLKSFTNATPLFVSRIERMRRAVYMLSYMGEQEGIGRATQKKKPQLVHDFKKKLNLAVKNKTLLDQDLSERIWVSLMKVRSRILDQFRIAVIQKLTPQQVLDKVRKSFPKTIEYKRPPRELKPIREADTDPKDKDQFSFDFVDDADWDLAVDAYKSTELPESRFDNAARFEDGQMRYQWEVEQDLADDFVQQVRAGQVDAANDLGIQEFVWVAIIDDKTDDCCLDRHGKTTSQIEEMMDSGELDSDCDATVPPAHPNCRCQLAPVGSTDEVEGPDWKTFNEWLET